MINGHGRVTRKQYHWSVTIVLNCIPKPRVPEIPQPTQLICKVRFPQCDTAGLFRLPSQGSTLQGKTLFGVSPISFVLSCRMRILWVEITREWSYWSILECHVGTCGTGPTDDRSDWSVRSLTIRKSTSGFKMATPSVNVSLDDIDLSSLRVSMVHEDMPQIAHSLITIFRTNSPIFNAIRTYCTKSFPFKHGVPVRQGARYFWPQSRHNQNV